MALLSKTHTKGQIPWIKILTWTIKIGVWSNRLSKKHKISMFVLIWFGGKENVYKKTGPNTKAKGASFKFVSYLKEPDL